MTVQAIAGVSASAEAKIMTVYPSISATAIGRLLGQLYDCIPIRVCGPTISAVLFALPTAPLAAMLYLVTKATGQRYVLTNRSVQVWASLGNRRISTVDFSQIEDVELEQQPGQKFYRASDIKLKGANGQTVLRLVAVGDAGSFRNAILRAIEARKMVQSAMTRIAARK